ncbi:MAG: hypothetical protein AB1807_20145 [Pseudomonadota bacterium]
MAKTNFQYEKRQRELEKKRKAEEKARRKLEAKNHPKPEGEEQGETVEVESSEPQTQS